jgi:sensor histidine kinase YesM
MGYKRTLKTDKSRFQKELERMVSKRIVVTILIGCLFFSVAIIVINSVSQEMNSKRHLEEISTNFTDVYQSTANFLKDSDNRENFLLCIQKDKTPRDINYLVSKYNVEAKVDINLILINQKDQIVMTTFSEENMNLHRREFNRIAATNARESGLGIYTTVYFFKGDASEYLMMLPLYDHETYCGTVAAYLKSTDWNNCLSQGQYDAIITNDRNDIIYCSNNSLTGKNSANKYMEKGGGKYIKLNDKRYLRRSRSLEFENIRIYSFIYSPENSAYMIIGFITITGLGGVWTVMFLNMLGVMSKKTSESVELLVKEIRIIRKEDTSHEITLRTGDEFEEIAEQINKMVKSINELNHRNIELIQMNGQMEMQNLQERMNPHFIYNTLDNIKYLIMSDPVRAENMIERFTHILRYSINNTKKKVLLQEDMVYIEDYLFIQKIRFGTRFDYIIGIEDECEQFFIPKLLLQPLLENSIKYGFRKKTDIHIKISGYIHKGYLYLVVEDDGAGQPKATLEMLKSITNREKMETKHNGLQNINRRISLEYGEESGMIIESQENEFFRVVLKLWMGENCV